MVRFARVGGERQIELGGGVISGVVSFAAPALAFCRRVPPAAVASAVTVQPGWAEVAVA